MDTPFSENAEVQKLLAVLGFTGKALAKHTIRKNKQ